MSEISLIHEKYQCHFLEELPGQSNLKRYFYPGSDTTGGSDGLTLKISPAHGEEWLGTFAFGMCDLTGNGITAFPNSDKFCLITRGAAYIIEPADPTNCEIIQCFPITDYRLIPDLGIVVFANYVELIAYNSEGMIWRTKRLCYDCLKIEEVTKHLIIGQGWNSGDENRHFQVDLKTGEFTGGCF